MDQSIATVASFDPPSSLSLNIRTQASGNTADRRENPVREQAKKNCNKRGSEKWEKGAWNAAAREQHQVDT